MSEYLEYDWRMNMLSTDLRKELRIEKTEPTDRNTAISALRSSIRQNADPELKNTMPQDDKTLLKFLYARKFNVDETYQLLQNYFWYRRRNPEIFKNFRLGAEDIRKALDNGLPGVLGSKDRKGRCVLIINATNWDCSYSLMSVYRYVRCVLIGCCVCQREKM